MEEDWSPLPHAYSLKRYFASQIAYLTYVWSVTEESTVVADDGDNNCTFCSVSVTRVTSTPLAFCQLSPCKHQTFYESNSSLHFTICRTCILKKIIPKGECIIVFSQSLINLLITGKAVTNVWDNDKDISGLSKLLYCESFYFMGWSTTMGMFVDI